MPQRDDLLRRLAKPDRRRKDRHSLPVLREREQRLRAVAFEHDLGGDVQALAGPVEKLARQETPVQQQQRVARELFDVDRLVRRERMRARHDGDDAERE